MRSTQLHRKTKSKETKLKKISKIFKVITHGKNKLFRFKKSIEQHKALLRMFMLPW